MRSQRVGQNNNMNSHGRGKSVGSARLGSSPNLASHRRSIASTFLPSPVDPFKPFVTLFIVHDSRFVEIKCRLGRASYKIDMRHVESPGISGFFVRGAN